MVFDEDEVCREDLVLVQQHVVRFKGVLVFTSALVNEDRVEPARLGDLHDTALRQVVHTERFGLLDRHLRDQQ